MTTTRGDWSPRTGSGVPRAVRWLLPVVDPDNRLIGVITVDDALDAAIPDSWRHRPPDTTLLHHHARTPTTPRSTDEPEE